MRWGGAPKSNRGQTKKPVKQCCNLNASTKGMLVTHFMLKVIISHSLKVTSPLHDTLRLTTLLLQQLYYRKAKWPDTYVFITPTMAKAPQGNWATQLLFKVKGAMQDNVTF